MQEIKGHILATLGVGADVAEPEKLTDSVEVTTDSGKKGKVKKKHEMNGLAAAEEMDIAI